MVMVIGSVLMAATIDRALAIGDQIDGRSRPCSTTGVQLCESVR